MIKILTIIGARPQFIKASPVSMALRKTGNIQEILVHTGQHYDKNMSDIFFSELEIVPPDFNLGIGGGTHGFQTGEMLKGLEKVMLEQRPELVLIYGDTNSTLAGALCAAKLNIPVAHVEAGLRSFNRVMPEEINRIVADKISSVLFCPTTTAIQNLRNEGVDKGLHNVGDVMYDAARIFGEKARNSSHITEQLGLSGKDDNKSTSPYILATVHRAENTDSSIKLGSIFKALSHIASDIPVILPLHPRTRKMLASFNVDYNSPGLNIIDPCGFLDMVSLEMNARCIVTDSGGVQKEAYFHKVPCITVRDQTEWVETVEAGWNRLADATKAAEIENAVRTALDKPVPETEIEEYGDGNASGKIARILLSFAGG